MCFPNDIAILTFAGEIPTSDVIKAVPPDGGDDRTSQLCYITGLGNLYGKFNGLCL
jgi:hypothetical protein